MQIPGCRRNSSLPQALGRRCVDLDSIFEFAFNLFFSLFFSFFFFVLFFSQTLRRRYRSYETDYPRIPAIPRSNCFPSITHRRVANVVRKYRQRGRAATRFAPSGSFSRVTRIVQDATVFSQAQIPVSRLISVSRVSAMAVPSVVLAFSRNEVAKSEVVGRR